MAPRNRIRLRLTRAAKSAESTPKHFDIEDEPMPDAEPNDEVPEQKRQTEQDDEDDEPAEPAADEEDAEDKDNEDSEPSFKEPTPPPQPVIRRKRLGRPPKNKPPDWDPMITVTDDTPRRRGRGGWRGRGGRKEALLRRKQSR